MNFRRHRKASAVVMAHEFYWMYQGKRYCFVALNVADAKKQVRECLSAKALREGFLLP